MTLLYAMKKYNYCTLIQTAKYTINITINLYPNLIDAVRTLYVSEELLWNKSLCLD